MRILLISDIHGNWPALAAIREEYDLAVCLGDIVDYGVEPGPCIDWVREHCSIIVRGNHDHAVAQRVNTIGSNGFRWLTAVTRPITQARIRSEQRRFLGELPTMRWLRLNGKRYLFVHASPRDPLDEYAPASSSFWAERLRGVPADVICVGHTHLPFQLQVGAQQIINPGSVGLPRDGDARVSYAILDGDRVEFHRIDYPIEQTIAAIDAAPLPPAASAMLREVLHTGRLSTTSAIPPTMKESLRVTG